MAKKTETKDRIPEFEPRICPECRKFYDAEPKLMTDSRGRVVAYCSSDCLLDVYERRKTRRERA